jgi:pyruvate/2-oxoglutarate/acetoin dehydrogenase E1 component
MKIRKIYASLFNVNSPTPTDWEKIIENVKNTKKLIIIDDSKSSNLACDALLAELCGYCNLEKKIILKRNMTKDNWLYPINDQMDVNVEKVIDELIS